MVKRLHTDTRIFFPNPIMIRISIPMDDLDPHGKYRKLIRRTYKEIAGTWGFSDLKYETCNQAAKPIQIVSQVYGMEMEARAYICFKEEIDALQFRLSIDANSRLVKMWPSCTFTIHEVVEDGS